MSSTPAEVKLSQMRDAVIDRLRSLTPVTYNPEVQVEQFHRAMAMPIQKPSLKNWAGDYLNMPLDRIMLRFELIREEFEELREELGLNESGKPAIEKGNHLASLSMVADALADIVYVCYGFAIEAGIPLNAVINEVHAANLTKLDNDGNPVYREDGKVMKSANYTAPQIQDAIVAMLLREESCQSSGAADALNYSLAAAARGRSGA